MTQINAVRSEQNLETLQLNDSLVFPLTIGHFEGMWNWSIILIIKVLCDLTFDLSKFQYDTIQYTMNTIRCVFFVMNVYA